MNLVPVKCLAYCLWIRKSQLSWLVFLSTLTLKVRPKLDPQQEANNHLLWGMEAVREQEWAVLLEPWAEQFIR